MSDAEQLERAAGIYEAQWLAERGRAEALAAALRRTRWALDHRYDLPKADYFAVLAEADRALAGEPQEATAHERIKAALAFAEQWETLSEVAVGMIRILRGEPDGIRVERGKSKPDMSE